MATLVKQQLLPDLDVMERRLRRMVEGFSLTPTFGSPGLPAADIYETPAEFVIELELPGYEETDLGVEISDHTLTIKGTRAESEDDEEKSYRLRERLECTFERRFLLPAQVDTDAVEAEFTKGVLVIHAPKVATAVHRTVAISS